MPAGWGVADSHGPVRPLDCIGREGPLGADLGRGNYSPAYRKPGIYCPLQTILIHSAASWNGEVYLIHFYYAAWVDIFMGSDRLFNLKKAEPSVITAVII